MKPLFVCVKRTDRGSLPAPAVMGVINVTPDSFSDGGVHFNVEPAVTTAWGMLDAGAAIVDVGGESTRPGSSGVSAEQELERVEPVLADLAGAPVSIDTSKAAVARRALELGVELVNDVTALRADPELAGVIADAGCYVCLMHMQGEPRTMQENPVYDDVVSDVKRFLEERLAFAVDAGIDERNVCLDPGIGFGKTPAHNFELVRRLDELCAIGRPVLIGLSRKSSFAKLVGRDRVGTLAVSVGAAVAAYDRGATILRVHDVREHVEALAAAKAVRGLILELRGLHVFGYHGVEEEEKRLGQLFLFDLELGGGGARRRRQARERDRLHAGRVGGS